MADSVDQIIDNIPVVIQTGIPENIKSYNHRPLMIEIAKHLVRGRENAENGKYYVIRGVNDPDNPGEVMFVMTQMSTQRQISVYDEYSDLPGAMVGTIIDQFFYVKETQTIYTREQDNSYLPLGYLKKIKVIEALPGSLISLPADEGVGVYVIEIKDSLGNIKSDAGVWLGGYSGIYVGHDSMVFAKEATPGGAYSDVGHQFVVINQRRQTVIEYYDHYSDFPNPGRSNVIYVEEDTMITYYWSPSIVDYVANGSAIYGELIDSTTFEDELGNIVTPGSANIYIDTTDDNKAYNWDGGQYVPINSTSSGGGGEVDWSNLTDKKHLRYDASLGKPVDSKVAETTTGIEVKGDVRGKGFIGKSVSANVASSYAIDLNGIAEHYILTMTDNTSISFSNMISNYESVVISLTVTGNHSMVLPSFLKPSPDNDDYDGTMHNEIVINIKRGGATPLGYYTLKNYEI